MAVKTQRKSPQLKLVPKVESHMKDMEKNIEEFIKMMADLMTKSVYFGLGSFVLIMEEFDSFFDRAIKKGEESEHDLSKRIKSMFKVEGKGKSIESSIETSIEAGVHKMMDTLDIPTKSDVDKLSRRVAELSNRVSKLAKS